MSIHIEVIIQLISIVIDTELIRKSFRNFDTPI